MSNEDIIIIKQIVRETILETLAGNFNKRDAAALIGISPPTLYKLINAGEVQTTPKGKIPMSEIQKQKMIYGRNKKQTKHSVR